MEYKNGKHLGGKASEAAKSIVDALAGQGFRIVTRHDASFELAGPGMNSSRHNPLAGASKVIVRCQGGQVTIEAEFAAVRRLIRALGVLIVGMAVLFLVLFGFIIPIENAGVLVRYGVPVLPLAPWPFLLPWMSWLFRRRTARAFDGLLQNLAAR